MINRKIFLITIVLAIATLIIFKQNIINIEIHDKKKTNIEKDEVTIKTKQHSKKTKENTKKIELKQNDFDSISVAIQSLERCGLDINSVDIIIDKLIHNLYDKPITEKQNDAKNRIISNCYEWYDYIAEIDTENLSKLRKIAKIRSNKMSKLAFGDFDENSIVEARESLYDLDPDIASSSIISLLKHDTEFKNYILNNAGFEDSNFLTNNSTLIAAMYSCKLSNDCGRNSQSNLLSCLRNESFCGKSFNERIHELYLSSHIITMETIISLISEKKKKGFD